MSCHSVTVILTLVQTKQIRINIHQRNNTKNTVQTIQNTVNTSIHITKTHKHYKAHTYSHPHITKPTHTHTPTHYKAS
jgi:Tfp pilus assembly protein PilP